MDMLTDFFTLPTGFFILMIYALSLVIREGFEAIFPVLTEKKSKSRWAKVWREFFLISIPIVLGGLISGLVSVYPYPEYFVASWQTRVPYGIVCGLLSAPYFRLFMVSIWARIKTIKKIISEKLKSQ